MPGGGAGDQYLVHIKFSLQVLHELISVTNQKAFIRGPSIHWWQKTSGSIPGGGARGKNLEHF